MGFGSFATSTSDANLQLLPQKRCLEVDDHTALPSKAMKIAPLCDESVECTKMSPVRDECPSDSTSAGSASVPRSSVSLSEEEVASPVVVQLPASDQGKGLNGAVDAAMLTFMEAWATFALERDGGKGDEEEREDRANEVCEAWTAERYEDMRATMVGLLPWLGPMQSAEAAGCNYQVLEFQGRKAPAVKGEAEMGTDEALRPKLAWLRNEPRGRAWEALCAVMAAASTRKEKSWLEAHETVSGLEEKLEKLPLCKSKKSVRRKTEIRKILEEEKAGGCGFFAEYLVHASGHLRVAFAPGPAGPTPASVVVTARLPLWDALQSLDDNGPLRGAASSRKWCMEAGRQFAFQTAIFGVDEESKQCRAAGANLKPDPKLRDLLRSKKPVVVLEIVAALASREIMKKQGLSAIVKAELAMLMREAKSRGEAVIFCLGSDSPHDLAQKVYVRPPISDHGLQCGYLRWRASADEPWARERVWDDRITMCLQMP